ncbi:MAG: hypothetical protein AB4060_21575 [Crocosphaera sp.]
MRNQNLKIFLASSSELKEDREQFEIFINRQNKKYIKQGIFLELVIWEDFLDAMSRTRLQDEYNKAIKECDLFVSLFNTKVGQYTEEEVMIAWEAFKENNKPLIYTYFKEAQINVSQANIEQLQSLQDFKRKLSDLGHFYTKYNNIEDLKYKFSEQLNKFLPELVETENNVNNTTRPDSMEEQKSRQAINAVIICGVTIIIAAINGIWQPWKTRIEEQSLLTENNVGLDESFKILVRRVDLNGDKNNEIVASYEPNATICGNRGCPIYVVQETSPGKWKTIFEFFGWLDLNVRKSRVNGYYEISIPAGRDNIELVWTFNGIEYAQSHYLHGSHKIERILPERTATATQATPLFLEPSLSSPSPQQQVQLGQSDVVIAGKLSDWYLVRPCSFYSCAGSYYYLPTERVGINELSL